MFKFRFKKWGLAKNLKTEQEEEIRVQAASGGIPAVPLIRGRAPGSKKLKRYVNRLAPEALPQCTSESSSDVNSRSPSASDRGSARGDVCRVQSEGSALAPTTPYRQEPCPPQLSISALLNPPDDLRLTQQSLRAVLDYTSNRVRKGVWDPTGSPYEAEDHAENWHNKVFQATGMIQRGKYREGFRLLDICYKNYTHQLDAEHPLLIIETYTSVLHLARIELALAHSLVRYLAGLCRIRLGARHPFARFWAALQAMGPAQVRQAVGAVTQAQFALLEDYFAPGAEFLIIQNVDSARTLREAGCIPLSSAESIIERAIRQRRLDTARPGADDFVCWARIVLALVFFRDGRHDLANAVVDDVGACIRAFNDPRRAPRAPGDEITLFTEYEYRSMRVHILRARVADADANGGDGGAAHRDLAACLRERLDFCLNAGGVGATHHYTTRAFAELEHLYQQAGDIEAAERLRADFDFAAQWEEVCKRADGGAEEDLGAAGPSASASAHVGSTSSSTLREEEELD